MARQDRQERRENRRDFFKEAGQQIGDALRQAKTYAGEKREDFKENVKEAIDNAKDAGKWLLLKPISPILKAALRSKGFNPPNDMEKLGIMFYENIVLKQKQDEAKATNDGTNIMTSSETPTYTVPAGNYGVFAGINPSTGIYGVTGNGNAAVMTANFDPVTISTIVSAIITWVQETRAKKAAGGKLTKAQEKALEAADVAEKQAEQSATDYAAAEVGNAVLDFGSLLVKYWWVIALLLGIALYAKNKG